MVALGYNEYVTQGGDWGGIITRKMASTYGGRHLKAWHTNIPIPEPPSGNRHCLSVFLATSVVYRGKAGIERTKHSVTVSLIALLACLLGSMRNWSLWTDNYYWSDDEVLTWISLYWFSRAGPAASLRIYFELRADTEDMGRNPTIPMGASFFPKGAHSFNPQRASLPINFIEANMRGHFAATERPEELVRDVRKMFAKGSPAFGIVPGRTGYDSHVQQ
ncbi:alpha/beta-hydrolase [Suillus subalutaceus]|uniref:alpha/beta-hydrolase n=1 Tax=Suillus subalutaceus TaxID=48586 RepID=UPI001B85D399|nr:alpha/beta-hydrolase [Suillus subalutaceus]KAG1848771.1 alpha/beta-hydrolase [Suillus subalutaceus]